MITVDVCFVAVGTRSTGYGHITRTIEVFQAFRSQATAVCLIRTDDEGLQLIHTAPDLHAVKSDRDLLAKLAGLRWRLIVCDFLDTSEDVLSLLKCRTSFIASISPISTVNQLADVVITRVPLKDKLKGVNLHGSNYIITGSEKQPYPSERLSIGVNFGGSDPEDQLTDFVREISTKTHKLGLALVLGPGYRGSFSSIFDTLIKNKDIDFSVTQSASKFWEILGCQDLLVLSGGMALYESIDKAMPAIAYLPNIRSLELIPADLRERGIPWIAHTVEDCVDRISEIYDNRNMLELQKKSLSRIDFSCNIQNLVSALTLYVK